MGIFQYGFERRGLLTTNFAECGGYLYTDFSEPSPDVQLQFMRGLVSEHGQKVRWGRGIACKVRVLRPESRGRVSLRSAKWTDPPTVDTAFFSNNDDLHRLLAAAKLAQRLLLNPAFDSVRGKPLYASAGDDAELLGDIRQRTNCSNHAVGTCKMGVDPMAVVDPQLRVYGIDRLRIVDASVMPTVVSSGTFAATIMIAEKAADMILSR